MYHLIGLCEYSQNITIALKRSYHKLNRNNIVNVQFLKDGKTAFLFGANIYVIKLVV